LINRGAHCLNLFHSFHNLASRAALLLLTGVTELIYWLAPTSTLVVVLASWSNISANEKLALIILHLILIHFVCIHFQQLIHWIKFLPTPVLYTCTYIHSCYY